MNSQFELFIASRYLRSHRKEKVVSVITLISICGVAAGVMALVIAMAVTNGMHNTLQRHLLGAMAHINILPRDPTVGMHDWRSLAARLQQLPHIASVTPALYEPTFLAGPMQSKGVVLKGVDIDAELKIGDALNHLKAGSLDRLRDPNAAPPGIILGSRFVEETGMVLNSNVGVLVTELAGPVGVRLTTRQFRVAGIFETGFYDIDDNWAYASLGPIQRAFSLGDNVNVLELKVDNLNHVDKIAKQVEDAAGPRYTTTTWIERNRQLFSALRTERLITAFTIGLIVLVAALNILVVLVMIVMEKYRDIAVLMSMGARRKQIRWIFMLQGVLIGVVGSALGLAIGHALAYFANKYRWIGLDETVYSMSFVPFEPRYGDGVWIVAAAILVSFLATIYPARNATGITPAEVLRYE